MAVWCVRCNESLPLPDIGDHLHLCAGEREEDSSFDQERAKGNCNVE